jgi:hypothetical protein
VYGEKLEVVSEILCLVLKLESTGEWNRKEKGKGGGGGAHHTNIRSNQ